MKKIYSLLLCMVAGLVCVTASAEDITWTLVCNMPDKIDEVRGYPDELAKPTEETTVYTCDAGQSVNLYIAEGYRISSFVNSAGTPQSNYGNYAYFYPVDGETYTLTLGSLDDLRTASCTVNVDDASKVRVQLGGTYSNVTLNNGENTVKFDPNNETTLSIQKAGSEDIYRVEVDGVNVAGSYGRYEVNLKQGCVVDITTAFPDVDYTVTFTYGEGAEGFWTSASVDGNTVSDFDGRSMTVHAGKTINVYANMGDYNLDYVAVDGQRLNYFYSPLSQLVTGDMIVHVEAHKWGTVKFTLNVDDPANVSFYQGDYTYSDPLTGIVAGDNHLEFPENNAKLNLKANSGCSIVSVTDGDGNILSYSSYNGITVTEGMKIYVETYAIKLDQQAVLWIDDKSAADYFFSCALEMGNERKYYEGLESGYNYVQFSEVYKQFGISWGMSDQHDAYLYINGLQARPIYEGGSTYEVLAENNDVIKVFLKGAPTKVNVSFTGSDDVDGVSVKRDYVTELADWNGMTDETFGGTAYVISGDNATAVKLNGDEVAKGEDGLYVVTIPADAATAEIDITGTSGIGNVAIDATDADAEVYNLQGIRVGRASELRNLPAGIYINAGRKVVVK